MNLSYFIVFVIPFFISFILTPLVKRIAFKVGAVDIPKDDRKIHKKPIARLGGLAIVVSVVFTIVVNIFFGKYTSWEFRVDRNTLGVLAGCFIVVIIGIIDDIKPQKAKMKLFFQILAALCIVFLSDIRVRAISNPFSESGVLELNYYFSCLVSICWLIGVTNAINLIDGLDGLAAGVSALSCIAMFFVSMILKDIDTEMITIILAGAIMGFLPYNFNPAKIFMGDTGSTFLGFTLGVISISGTLKAYTTISIIIPLLILGLPLFDTTFTILRRICTGRPVMEADRGHIHHKLIDMGFSQRQAVLLMYFASAVLGVSAVWITQIGQLSMLMTIVIVTVLMLMLSKFIADILRVRNYRKGDK